MSVAKKTGVPILDTERVIAEVSATRSSLSMPRRNIAIASAPT